MTIAILVGIIFLGLVTFLTFKTKKKIERIDLSKVSFTQVDFTESFGDNLKLKPEDWITTIPINSNCPNTESMGLPPLDANSDQVYVIAEYLSLLRGQITGLNDGVYCPICHMANNEIKKLHEFISNCFEVEVKAGYLNEANEVAEVIIPTRSQATARF
jgi:hypothetical protein